MGLAPTKAKSCNREEAMNLHRGCEKHLLLTTIQWHRP